MLTVFINVYNNGEHDGGGYLTDELNFNFFSNLICFSVSF